MRNNNDRTSYTESEINEILKATYNTSKKVVYSLRGKGYFRNYSGAAFDEMVKDVSQEVCLAVFVKILDKTFSKIKLFHVYVAGITRNKTSNFYREQRKSQELENLDNQLCGIEWLTPYRHYDPEKLLIIKDTVERLPHRRQQMLKAYSEENRSSEEKGRQFGCTANTFSVTIHNIKKILTKAL
jgi:RNA polymerase sigma factor (sigma-70 family)